MSSVLPAPDRIGPYPIERELGRGGMGVVYLARDPRLERPVAIKVLPDALAHDPERIARFEREARLLAALHHANIGGIHGLEETNGKRFLVLEYVEGDTLAQRLARGPLPVDEALDVCRQIALALEAAHESGIIHRDLKPGNVKLTPGGEVKVLDFGLAKGGGGTATSTDVDLSASPTLTYAATGIGVILGTAAYMSPEQARGKVVDRRTDIWSFGCVLYECLTGRQLFAGETVSDTIAKILEREPDWSALPPATPANVRHLLQRCLEKDARRRLRDIGDARLELESAPPARAGAIVAAPAPRRRDSAPMAWALAGMLAVASLALGVPRLLHRAPAPGVVRFAVTLPAAANLRDNGDVAVSPDGRMIAYCMLDSSGTDRLLVRPLDAYDPRPLDGTEHAQLPFWSPDSRMIAFFADGKLRKVGLSGGMPEDLCPANNGRGGSWGPNHTIVFGPAGEGPVYKVSDIGGEPVAVTTLDAARHETAHRFPCFLPDGRHFLYTAIPEVRGKYNVFVGSLDGAKPRLVATLEGAPIYSNGYLLYRRNDLVAAQRFDTRGFRVRGEPLSLEDHLPASSYTAVPMVSVSGTGVLVHAGGSPILGRLYWIDRAGRRDLIPGAPARYQYLAVSPDGRSVMSVIASGASHSDIWSMDLERGVVSRVTFEDANVENVSWSPDGRSIVFDSNPDGPWDLYTLSLGGSSKPQLLYHSPVAFKHATNWSPDGRYVVFEALDAKTGFDIWTVSTDGSHTARPYLQGPYNERWATLSPDGRWMAYSSDESGKFECYVQSFPAPGAKRQVSLNGGFFPGWRKDGKEIVFGDLDGSTIKGVDVQTGATFQCGTPRPLFKTAPNWMALGISADFQRMVVAVADDNNGATPIEVVLNWPTALAKR